MTLSTKEITLSTILIILLLIICDPFAVLMTPIMLAGTIASLVVCFAFFINFVWHEHARDEREVLHRMIAGRNAFLSGSGILLIGIIYQTVYHHSVDPWLLLTLSSMIIAKLIGIISARIHT